MSGIKRFVPAICCCAAALFLILSAASDVTAQVNTDKEVPVQIRLIPDKKTIMLGEPLFISFEVTNQSGEKLGLAVGGDYRNRFGRPDSFIVSVIGADDKALPQIEVVDLGGMTGWEPIQPGATFTVRLFLAHWAVIERPGSYRIYVTRHMDFKSYGPSETEYLSDASANTEITVVPADENKMGEVINSLGSVMLDISNPQAVDSATALASINDKRTITYFAEAIRKFGDLQAAASHKGEYTIAARSIAALAKYDDDRALDALRSAMDSPSEDTRLNVAFALAESSHKSALDLLLKMQNDHFHSVRLKVAQRLRDVKTKEAQDALRKLAKDGVKEVREAAKSSLN